MDNSDIITLVSVERATDSSGTENDVISDTREALCRINSIGVKESYAAQSVGRNPELKATIAESSEYCGEPYALYNNEVYKITRTYIKSLSIELTLERTRDLKGLV